MALTVKKIERECNEPGKRYSDRGNIKGLYLAVSREGVRSWLFRYMVDGRERWMGLGPLHAFGLDEARERARKARQQLIDGIDPLTARQNDKAARQLAQAKALTFAEAAKQYIISHEASWTNPVHIKQWTSTIESYANPVIGNLPIATIDRPLVLRVLEQPVKAERGYPGGPLWSVRVTTASRLRGRIERILDWAKVRGYREGENPAAWSGNLKEALAAPSAIVKTVHYPALPYADLPGFMAALRSHQASVAARALEFTILTAARTSETIGAPWSEFDLAAGIWVIPASRMKAGREHRVPLSPQAVELLNGLHREAGNDFVFIGPHGAGLSNAAMTAMLKRMGHGDVTVHGFRSTFRDWAAERTNYANHIVEMALAHAIGDQVEKAYRRGDLLDKRRKLMEAWATYCCTPPVAQDVSGVVVALRG